MTCPKCGSQLVTAQAVNEVQLKDKHHRVIWWALVGWWWIPIKWLFLTLPALIFKLFGHKKQRAINVTKTVCVCQNCGHRWEI